jgi:hypothetical protein
MEKKMYNFKFSNSNNDFHETAKFMEIINKSDPTPEERKFRDKVLERTDVWATNDNGFEVKLND